MAKILIVDDEAAFLTLYSALLQREGYEVLTAVGAKEGLALALSEQPNLILLDVMMPSIDGGKASESLSENARTRQIPVIFLTSLIKDDEVENARGEVGGREYISKSSPKEKFIGRVRSALSA